MSTPVSATPPRVRSRATQKDLTDQMQRMIDLQYQQQQFYSGDGANQTDETNKSQSPPLRTSKGASTTTVPPPPPPPPLVTQPRPIPPQQPDPSSLNLSAAPFGGIGLGLPASAVVPKSSLEEHGSTFLDPHVGIGTLVWNSQTHLRDRVMGGQQNESSSTVHDYRSHNNDTLNDDDDDDTHSPAAVMMRTQSQNSVPLDYTSESHEDDLAGLNIQQQQQLYQQQRQLTQQRNHPPIHNPPLSSASNLRPSTHQIHNLASYGATVEEEPSSAPTPRNSQVQEPQDHQHQQQQEHQDPQERQPLQPHAPSSIEQRQMEYGYGATDFHDPLSHARLVAELNRADEMRRRHKKHKSFLTCLLDGIIHWFEDLFLAESLHRSFCYGAIDGMLTGSGIVSTFVGMDLLVTTQVRALVVAFTAATCFADAACMSIGHVWSTYVLAASQAAEKTNARWQLQRNKADAKGMLVDMLLSKGMLKIDAMSLADTLEGYPDLFVAAVTGDSLSSVAGPHPLLQQQHQQPLPPPPQNQSPQQQTHHEHQPGDARHDDGSGRRPMIVDLSINESDVDRLLADAPSSRPSLHEWRGFPSSYGRLAEYDMDPEVYTVRQATLESRKESLCMMLGFSLFSVVPSLVLACVPVASSDDDTSSFVNGIDPHLLVVVVTASVMWCLGVWKSRFLDSNWFLFGIETVLVLFVCIGCAYGLGKTLNALFLPENYILEVVKVQSVSKVLETTKEASKSASSSSHYSSHYDFFF